MGRERGKMEDEKYINTGIKNPIKIDISKFIIIILIMTIIVIISTYFLYITFSSDNKNDINPLNQTTNQTIKQSNIPENNITSNQSDSNTSLNNESITNQSNNQSLDNSSLQDNLNTSLIPNPTGTITIIDRNTNDGGYFCNKTTNPKHAIRLYTYRIINGVKNLSAEYIETKKKNDFCSYYSNIPDGINFYLEWQWNPIENINGYRIFRYYSIKGINNTINFDKYRDVNTNKLIDSGLDLWT